ncbi:MAG: RHS repeat-associated core domain-containing protein, partial [Chloroflexota bacterium]|nr:RHS repeat-associated core domain-containing protein [Chloroflexota bacterium]
SSTGTNPTDYLYTGQRQEAEIGLYFYNARFYDSALARFTQADTIIPGAGNPMALDRYAYVENNSLKYIDLYGHEKYIIIYGTDPNTNSFRAAAETQYQEALDAGYSKEDILIVDVSTDDEFFAAIANSEENEIEQIHIFSHGWAEDIDHVWRGGLQLFFGSPHVENQLTLEDFGVEEQALSNRFSDDAEMHVNACQVGRGAFPQDLANVLGITVYAYDQDLKFWQLPKSQNPFLAPLLYPYTGDDDGIPKKMNPHVNVFMGPAWLKYIPSPLGPKKFTPN